MKKLGKHKGIIQDANKFVTMIQKLPDIRIRCGVIKPNLVYSSPRMTIDSLTGAIKVSFRTKNAMETFFIYGDTKLILETIKTFTKKEQIELTIKDDLQKDSTNKGE